MKQVGYQLIDAAGAVVSEFGGIFGQCPAIPNPLVLPNGDQVCGAAIDADYSGFTLIPWMMEKPVQTVFDGLTFLARFTDAEYGDILFAAQTNVHLARWLDMVRLANSIDVTSDTVLAAKAGVVQLGLLSPARAAVIFATA